MFHCWPHVSGLISTQQPSNRVPDESRVPQEIASPLPGGIHRQPIEPFKTHATQNDRRAILCSAEIVEQGPNAPTHRHVDLIAMIAKPELLPRAGHAYEQDVRSNL